MARKTLAKTIHLYTGVDLMGSKTSVHYKEAEIEVLPIGAKITSKKTKRVIVIPWANIKGAELFPEELVE